jgi:hypothetical protein
MNLLRIYRRRLWLRRRLVYLRGSLDMLGINRHRLRRRLVRQMLLLQ